VKATGSFTSAPALQAVRKVNIFSQGALESWSPALTGGLMGQT